MNPQWQSICIPRQIILFSILCLGKPHLQELLEKVQLDTERDNYMTAQQAKEYGLIDDILYKH